MRFSMTIVLAKLTEQRERQHGFSLIELMVIIAIGAILFSISVGAYASIRENTRVESAKEHIVSILQQARLKALATGENQVVAFNWPADSIMFQNQTYTFDSVNLKGFTCTGSVTNDVNTDNSFTFKSRGNVTFQGAGTKPENLQISSAKSLVAFVIKVNDVTGRVVVVPGLACS